MRRRFGQVFVICLLISGSVQAQSSKKITHQHLIGYRFYHHLTFAKNWEWGLEIDERRYIFPDAQDQFVVRNHIHRTLPNQWVAGLGFTYFLQTLPQDPAVEDTYVRPELRPHQELKFRHKLSKHLSLSHRYRLEERFIRQVDEHGNLQEGYNFNFRFRYQLQAEIELIKKETKKGALGLKVSDEIHLNFGKQIVKNTFDQNRIGASLTYGLTKNIELEGGCFNWFQQRSSGDAYYSRNIIRFTLHHYLSL